ncbi:PREDICTED: uncharacterized protein LOC109463839 [Branchiostoma belcheri]|uniref:Uncharacterized protein LOC109463839 n=1 Tax=Branchiostoma belcheri TaxID=7741 RepID=A0A6P4XIA8_BRABE|nr:PREDICTED: uncharacterized protein LOC109463839 [Branchiostoma belcheri]
MKKAVGVALPLVMILAVAVYLAVTGSTKKESSNQGHRVIKRSLVLPSDLQEAMRAASAEDAPAYEKNKRFIPAIANLAGNILSKADSVDTDKLTDTVQKLGSMKNMAPDIMADSVQKEAEVTAEIEKNVAQQTISQLLDKVEHDHDKKEEGGEDGGGDGGGEENEIKAEIDFVPQKGMVEEDLFAPPGMNMKMDIEENPQADDNADDMSEPTAFSYPLGMGGALMDGCFGTDYTPEDPCYNQKTVQPACGASVDSAWGGSQESQKQSFMSLIECDVIRYEIFLDEVTPDSLSLAFLRDFLSLPKNFINGKAKLQEFIIRYGTHYIKSAKFGGSFRLFKTQEASKTSTLSDFSIQAQASYNGMFSAGGHYGRQESSEQSSSSKSSSSHVMVEGGEQEVAAVVSDFYTTNFKETFTEWLKSIPSYPKPIEMFMGTMSELLNLNFKLLFPFDISDAADGCFANKYCDVTSIDQFQVEMDQKRLALERAIAIYMEEGPIPTADFHLRGGKPGCQAEALTVKAGATGVTHPSWTELINGDTYKALGDLPRNYADGIVGRAEYISPLEHSQKNSGALSSIVEAPCTVKWSNSYQIKPADEGGKCLYFIGASKGDIFVVFSSIPKDKTTWYHLQISFQGVALYKGMRLVKYEGAKNARSLGDSKLFQPYFICLDEDMDKQQTYIKYGIGSDTSEKGLVYMVYLDESTPLGIRFYSFGSGEADVEIMDARVIEGGATGQMECTGGTVLKDGMCVEDCHPECNGCIPSSPGSKLDTECRMCRHFSVSKGGSIRCVASCPADTKLSSDGVTCELTNPPQDCADLFAAGTRQSGTYTVGEPSPYRVYCDMSFLGGGWTVLQRRQDGSVDFAKNWADYQQGFGDPNAEFWLGLDNIHTLTTAKSNILRIELENFNGERRYARYSSFSVGDASGNYVVSISGYSGDAGDSLTNSGRADINGRMFSTIDRDNDGNSVNCASSYSKGGWWYPLNCGESFLNGRYNCHESSVNCGNSQGVVWSSWGGASYLLKKTTIMIRPAVGFTDLGLNLAFEKPTAQSSTGYGGVAERAVDGNTDWNWGGGSCTHTNQEGTPWWRVDLGTSQAIGSVVVFNRNEQSQRLNNFRVHVGDSTTVTSNPQCGGNHAATGKQKITVDCDGRRGRYVGISIPATTILTLCEVQVYGAGIGKK